MLGYSIAELVDLDSYPEERVYCFALDGKLHLQGMFLVSTGVSHGSLVSAREVLRNLLLLNAERFILVHNHPSGDPTPSQEDIELTMQLKEAGKLLGVDMLDHVIHSPYDLRRIGAS